MPPACLQQQAVGQEAEGGGRGWGWAEPNSLIHLPACHQTKVQHQQPVRMKMHNQSPATTETRKCGEFEAED